MRGVLPCAERQPLRRQALLPKRRPSFLGKPPAPGAGKSAAARPGAGSLTRAGRAGTGKNIGVLLIGVCKKAGVAGGKRARRPAPVWRGKDIRAVRQGGETFPGKQKSVPGGTDCRASERVTAARAVQPLRPVFLPAGLLPLRGTPWAADGPPSRAPAG